MYTCLEGSGLELNHSSLHLQNKPEEPHEPTQHLAESHRLHGEERLYKG